MVKKVWTPKRRHQIKSFLRKAKHAINNRRREIGGIIFYAILDLLEDGAVDGSLLFSHVSLDASPWLLVLL